MTDDCSMSYLILCLPFVNVHKKSGTKSRSKLEPRGLYTVANCACVGVEPGESPIDCGAHNAGSANGLVDQMQIVLPGSPSSLVVVWHLCKRSSCLEYI